MRPHKAQLLRYLAPVSHIMCVGGSQDHPTFRDSPEGTHGTQSVVVLMAKVYCSDVIRTHSWTIMEKAQEESGGPFVQASFYFPP